MVYLARTLSPGVKDDEKEENKKHNQGYGSVESFRIHGSQNVLVHDLSLTLQC